MQGWLYWGDILARRDMLSATMPLRTNGSCLLLARARLSADMLFPGSIFCFLRSLFLVLKKRKESQIDCSLRRFKMSALIG